MITVDCRWCAARHTARFLCDPARKILNALYARGMEGNMPSIEFPAPIPAEQLGYKLGGDPGDRLLRQLVINAITLDVAGIPRPGLILTGQDNAGDPLPRWVYAADDAGIRAAAKLVDDMGRLAIRTAAKARS